MGHLRNRGGTAPAGTRRVPGGCPEVPREGARRVPGGCPDGWIQGSGVAGMAGSGVQRDGWDGWIWGPGWPRMAGSGVRRTPDPAIRATPGTPDPAIPAIPWTPDPAIPATSGPLDPAIRAPSGHPGHHPGTLPGHPPGTLRAPSWYRTGYPPGTLRVPSGYTMPGPAAAAAMLRTCGRLHGWTRATGVMAERAASGSSRCGYAAT